LGGILLIAQETIVWEQMLACPQGDLHTLTPVRLYLISLNEQALHT
jgi:hypothetical protein